MPSQGKYAGSDVRSMTLQQLRYVTTIVDCGSMNEASHQLFVSQPALSKSVRDLEEEIGITIFSRSRQGITLTQDGSQFIAYARQICELADQLEDRYNGPQVRRQMCTISTQHYMFASEALAGLVRGHANNYEFRLRETTTRDIMDQVSSMRADVGILYLSSYNSEVITRELRSRGLRFHPLFRTNLHVFMSSLNPLSNRTSLSLSELSDLPFIRYEQGDTSSLFFAEEAVWPHHQTRVIDVSDRATMLNLIVAMNAFTICSGIDNNHDLNPKMIRTVPLKSRRHMLIGWIDSKRSRLSAAAHAYLKALRLVITAKGYELLPPTGVVE